MAKTWPTGLPIFQRSKTREQPAKFKTNEPRRGHAYFQQITNDQPVFWNVTLKLNANDRKRFWLWYTLPTYLNGGVEEFTLPIKTEFGLVTHTCRFLPDSLMQVSEDHGIFTYTAQIMARALVIPQNYLDMADWLLSFEDFDAYASQLDVALQAEWPKAA